jgi:Holliday junction resolvasome RuvABC endonuclease subunit
MALNTLTLSPADAKPPTVVPGASSPTARLPVLLALDLATTTGFALRTAEGAIHSGTVSFRPSRYDGGGIRYLRFGAWLESLIENAGGIDVVHHEEVRRHLSTDAAHVHGGLLATLTAWCERRRIPYQGVPVGTIKRHITGRGNAGKEEVIAAVRALGFNPADDNEADALAILHWAMSTRGGVA